MIYSYVHDALVFYWKLFSLFIGVFQNFATNFHMFYYCIYIYGNLLFTYICHISRKIIMRFISMTFILRHNSHIQYR